LSRCFVARVAALQRELVCRDKTLIILGFEGLRRDALATQRRTQASGSASTAFPDPRLAESSQAAWLVDEERAAHPQAMLWEVGRPA
jgi:hypothetical protein